MVEFKKDILLSIHNIDGVAYKFNSKFKFLNLQHLVQIIDHMNKDQLKNCSEKILVVEKSLQAISNVFDGMESEVLELIASYDRTQYLPELNTQSE